MPSRATSSFRPYPHSSPHRKFTSGPFYFFTSSIFAHVCVRINIFQLEISPFTAGPKNVTRTKQRARMCDNTVEKFGRNWATKTESRLYPLGINKNMRAEKKRGILRVSRHRQINSKLNLNINGYKRKIVPRIRRKMLRHRSSRLYYFVISTPW